MFSPVETRYSNPPWATLLQRKLIENPMFRNRFINQIADLLNTNFLPDRVIAVINTLANHIASEIGRHRSRWGIAGENLDKMTAFAQQRPAYLRTHIRDYFNCGDNGTLNIDATTGGFVQLNTLRLQQADMPFAGIYFQNNGIHLRAVPDAGYKFDGWSGDATSNDESLILSVSGSTTLFASFSPDTAAVKDIVINEINYNSADDFDSGDWVEFYNRTGSPVDISGWTFSDSDENHKFIFPNGTVIDPDHYLVLVENDSAFISRFPEVQNFTGETGFGLNGAGEFIKLTDGDGQIMDSLTYDDALPWPVEADGYGKSLELSDPEKDNAKVENWKTSAEHGTPGRPNAPVSVIGSFSGQMAPDVYALSQNYPNPFNPATTISYSVPKRGRVSLSVYDLLGRVVATLVNRIYPAGRYEVTFNGGMLSSGVYLYRMQSGDFSAVRKFILLK